MDEEGANKDRGREKEGIKKWNVNTEKKTKKDKMCKGMEKSEEEDKERNGQEEERT